MESTPPVAVGQRIRALREQRQLSLRALAERCGLSINAISQIERGENSPTVSSLHQLATALGVTIIDFFRQDEGRAVVFVAAADRLHIETHGVRMESLGLGLPYQQLEPFLVTVAAGAGSVTEPVSHEGEEFVHCLSGEFIYQIDQEQYYLKPGDSLLFDPARPHHFYNPMSEPAAFLLIILADGSRSPVPQLHLVGLRPNT
jgi:transcriptional regulator with XRE-family HTH domain